MGPAGKQLGLVFWLWWMAKYIILLVNTFELSRAGCLRLGVPKPTEMTIRDLLQEELRKRGVTNDKSN